VHQVKIERSELCLVLATSRVTWLANLIVCFSSRSYTIYILVITTCSFAVCARYGHSLIKIIDILSRAASMLEGVTKIRKIIIIIIIIIMIIIMLIIILITILIIIINNNNNNNNFNIINDNTNNINNNNDNN
jgi:hypothetical protein